MVCPFHDLVALTFDFSFFFRDSVSVQLTLVIAVEVASACEPLF